MKRCRQAIKNLMYGQRDEIGSGDVFDEITDDWQEKARRLQARRWHKIRHQGMLFQ